MAGNGGRHEGEQPPSLPRPEARADYDSGRRRVNRRIAESAIRLALDGRFLINKVIDSAAAPITLLMNWQGGLSAREK